MPLKDQRVLVVGATSQVGWFLLPRLLAAGAEVLALSRRGGNEEFPSMTGVHWCSPDTLAPELSSITHLVSAGPLSVALELCRKLPALKAASCSSSSSVLIKAESPQQSERELMARMLEAEAALKSLSADQGFSLTLLQPTLLYGAGMDQNISLLARYIRRFGFLPVSRRSKGLRQPLHVDDLAQALIAGISRPQGDRLHGPICGGETLSYRAMVERIFTAMNKPPRVIELPQAIFAHSLTLMAQLGIVRGAHGEMVRRQAIDLIFDDSDTWRQLGIAPRGFTPGPGDFERPSRDQLRRLSGRD